MERKAVSLFSMCCMCIGSIIGGGVFGSLCVAVQYAGIGILLACVIAFVFSIISSLPGMLPSTVTPAASGYYTVLCKIISPYLGPMEFTSLLTLVVLNVSLASTFSVYLAVLVPVNTRLASCVVILVASLVAYIGFTFGSKVQNVMTMILLAAVIMFVLMGLRHVDLSAVSQIGIPSSPSAANGLTGIFAATGLMMNCMDGGDSAMILAEKMKNPRRDVLLTFLISTSFVAVIYFFMSLVVVGTAPEAANLAEAAGTFMGPAALTVFVIGGALMAILTTLNCITLSGAVRFEAMARDGLLPQFFDKRNRFGQSYAGVFVVAAAAIIITLFDLPLGTLFSVLSALSLFMMIFYLLPVLKLRRMYPHTWAHSPFLMSDRLIYVLVAAAMLACAYQTYSLIKETAGPVWLAVAGMIILFYLYFFLRKGYLKHRGEDLYTIMKQPLPEWEEKEAFYAGMDEASNRRKHTD